MPIQLIVESPAEISGMLTAYLGTSGGVVPAPTAPLVTGYDFLTDAANAVKSELAAGTGQTVDTLITPANVSPLDPQSWTAAQLKTKLLGSRHDLVFLALHGGQGENGTMQATLEAHGVKYNGSGPEASRP